MHKAVFLDRDGTINEDVGDLWQPDKLRFIPGAAKALRQLQKCYMLFVVTNQAGIGRGFFSDQEYARFTEYFLEQLRTQGVRIRAVAHCPHRREDGCLCHKPGTRLIDQLAATYRIDTPHSFIVGDHPHDIEMARRAGAGAVYVLTGHGRKHQKELVHPPDYIAADILAAAQWIHER